MKTTDGETRQELKVASEPAPGEEGLGLNGEQAERRKFLKSALAAGVMAVAPAAEGARHIFGDGAPAAPFSEAALNGLKASMRGDIMIPGSEGYDQGRTGYELGVRQSPAIVAMVANQQDVISAVNFARDHGLGVGVQATGHGITAPANGGVLINTSCLKNVELDPEARSARVGAGVKWADVLPEATPHGLAALSGSTTDVGVVGYTTGGGTGWFVRRYGFAADSVRSADVVTADGRPLHASPAENSDLFWALRGGNSNFGIITSLEFSLYPVKEFYGGGIFYPIEKAREVLRTFSEWVKTLPDTLSSRVVILNIPPLPFIPEPLRGRWVIAVQGALLGKETEGVELLRPIRQVGPALLDSFAMMPYSRIDTIANDPVDPTASVLHSEVIREITLEMIDQLLGGIRPRSVSLAMVEMRHLGGALARTPENGSAVGRPDGLFWFNALAVYRTAAESALAEDEIARVREAVQPFTTGRVFLNGLGGTAAAARVSAAYSPENYRRLVTIKRKYDPGNLFRFNRNIPPA